jgi:hypothetical protein
VGLTYEDAIEIAKCIGIEIGTHISKGSNGKAYTNPDIWFSGFWSQGDGCCFSGQLRIADMGDAVKKLETHVGKSEGALFNLAFRAQEIYNSVVIFQAKHRLLGTELGDLPHGGEELSATITIEGNDRYYSTQTTENRFGETIEDDMNELVSDFADWIYRQLEAEHDYLTSDEAIKEMIDANDYLFDEDGVLI